jgi:hypothetical protein
MSQIEMMKQSAQREADAKLRPQQLLKEVETLAAVVQIFRASVSGLEGQVQEIRANLERIRQDSERQHRGTTRTILLTGTVTGLVCTTLMSLIVLFISPPQKPSAIEDRVLELMVSPNLSQDAKDWLSSNVILPRP